MRLRATTRIRNDAMISARQSKGWSQRDLAKHADVPMSIVQELEKLKFTGHKVEERALAVAVALGIPSDEVMPLEMVGAEFDTDRVDVREVPAGQLLGYKEQRLFLPHGLVAPESDFEPDDKLEIQRRLEALPWRQREIIELRYGLKDGHEYTLREVGRILKIGSERVRQIEGKAIRKLQDSRTPLRKRGEGQA